MSLVFGFLLVAVAALYVALPFLRREGDAPLPEAVSASPLERLEQQKREAYAAIKEAQFDHQMGKLSDADLQAITEKYRAEALAAIAALDAHREAADDRAPARIAFCPTCGRKLPGKANFCPGCGRAIKADRAALQGQPAPAKAAAASG